MTVIYYRSAKTGSSSICKAIEDSKYKTLHITRKEDLVKLKNDLDIIIVGVAANPLYKLYDKIQNALKEKISSHESFGVTRCPYSKFISSINYRRKNDADLRSIASGEIHPKTKGADWVHIFRTQTQALFRNGKCIPKNIIKFENLNEGTQTFFGNLGYDIKIPHLNKTKKKHLRLNRSYINFINKHYSDDFKNFEYTKTQ